MGQSYRRTLFKTDKNGTQYYNVIGPCPKCAGHGRISAYSHVEGGICFECGGDGLHGYVEKVMTPEYEAKLEARRQAREDKRLEKAKAEAEEKNQEFFQQNGYNSDGFTYYICGDTYSAKDELKEAGAKWDSVLKHWHINHELDSFTCVKVNVNDLFFSDRAGQYHYTSRYIRNDGQGNVDTVAKELYDVDNTLKAGDSKSEFYGIVGERVSIRVNYKRTNSFYNEYKTYYMSDITYIYTFEDTEGRVFVWKTDKGLEFDNNEEVMITGAIKEHKERKGIKQTILTRCKIKS